VLRVEACVRAHGSEARRLGATLNDSEPAVCWAASERGVSVTTTQATYTAAKLVITAGPWAKSILNDAAMPLTVMRQVMHWFEPRVPMGIGEFPIFLMDTPAGAFYGVPDLDGRGVKVARHYGAAECTHPDQINGNTHHADEEPVRAFLNRYLPGRLGLCRGSQSCIYTLSPDRHFVIDHHPSHANVCFAAGFSGHGFKFAPVVGEILAELTLIGATCHPIALFRRDRFPA
jgi:sarcosine oxidase